MDGEILWRVALVQVAAVVVVSLLLAWLGRRSVRREAGLSLKRFARVTRLLAAVTRADRSAGPSWAAIAADGGYCDQSHLVRECRAITGLAPSEIHRERRAQEAETSNPR